MPRLLVEKGIDKGKVFFVSPQGTILLGRDTTADIRIGDVMASRVHFRIEVREDEFYLYDQESLNGTFLNGRRVTESRLQFGDSIQVGETLFSFLSDDVVADPLVGQKVSGYRIMQRIGRGGMGTVYKAEQIDLQRVVALKVISPEHAKDAAFLNMFLHEARAVAKLNHPNIVQIYDVKKHADVYFFSMEYLAGGSVQDQLSKTRTLPIPMAIDVVLDAARGLEYAHKKEIIHRDIKPDNLMLSETQTVKIGDLGLARSVSDQKKDIDGGIVLGTPHYIAPELLFGSSPTFVSDIYSLGATMYRLVAGVTPFTAATVKDLVHKKTHEDPAPVVTHNPEVPKRLAAAIHRMLDRDPAKRFAGAREVISELDEIKLGRTSRHTPPEPVKKPVKPIVWIAGSAAAGIIILLAVLLIGRGPTKPVEPQAKVDTSSADAVKALREENARQLLIDAERFERNRMEKRSPASVQEAIGHFQKVVTEYSDTESARKAQEKVAALKRTAGELDAATELGKIELKDVSQFRSLQQSFQKDFSPDVIDVKNKKSRLNELVLPVLAEYEKLSTHDTYGATPAGTDARDRAAHIRAWLQKLSEEQELYRKVLADSRAAAQRLEFQEAWQVLNQYIKEVQDRSLPRRPFARDRYASLLFHECAQKAATEILNQGSKSFEELKQRADELEGQKKFSEAIAVYQMVFDVFKLSSLMDRASEEQQRLKKAWDSATAREREAEEERKRELKRAERVRFDAKAQEAYPKIAKYDFKGALAVLEKENGKFQTKENREALSKRLEQLRVLVEARDALLAKMTLAIRNGTADRMAKVRIASKERLVPLTQISDEGFEFILPETGGSGRMGKTWKDLDETEYFEMMRGWLADTDKRALIVMAMELGLYEEASAVLELAKKQSAKTSQEFIDEYQGYLKENNYPESAEVEARKRLDRVNRFVKEKKPDQAQQELELYKNQYSYTQYYKEHVKKVEQIEEKLQ